MLIHLSRNGQTDGPYSAEQFENMLCSGQVEKNDVVWVQSDGWEPLAAFERCFGPHSESSPQSQQATTPTLTNSSPATAEMRLSSYRSQPQIIADDEGNENLLRTMMGI